MFIPEVISSYGRRLYFYFESRFCFEFKIHVFKRFNLLDTDLRCIPLLILN